MTVTQVTPTRRVLSKRVPVVSLLLFILFCNAFLSRRYVFDSTRGDLDLEINREIKLDVTWSYVERQTAKMTFEFVFFSSNPSLNHIKNKKMSATIRHKYKYFHLTVQRAKDKRQKFHFCRLPFDARPRNVKLNLSNSITYLLVQP